MERRALNVNAERPSTDVTTSFLQLGSKFGTWLLERGLTPRYGYIGTNKEGCGGLTEQIPHQGLDPQCKWQLPSLGAPWR